MCTRAHTRPNACRHTRVDGYPFRGISPSASAISRFQAPVLIRPQTSLPWPNAHRPTRVHRMRLVRSLQILFCKRIRKHISLAERIRSKRGTCDREMPKRSSESRSQCARTGAILEKKDATREQQVKVSSPWNNVVGNRTRCALSRFPVRCLRPV